MTSTITTTLTVLLTVLAFVAALVCMRGLWRGFKSYMQRLHRKHRMAQHREWQKSSKGAVAWARERAKTSKEG